MSAKYLILSALLCSFAYASNGIPIPKYTPSLMGPYLEGDVGVASVDWKHFASQFGPRVFADGIANSSRYAEGGVMGGADGGYQINQNFAIEVGAVALPRAKATGRFMPVAFPASSESNSFFVFIGGKMQKLFATDNFVFLKMGVAYRYIEFRTISNFTGLGFSQKTYRFLPVFSFGVTHFFSPAFTINFQYMYLPAVVDNFETFPGGNVSRLNAPRANIFLIGLGYMYNGSYQGIK